MTIRLARGAFALFLLPILAVVGSPAETRQVSAPSTDGRRLINGITAVALKEHVAYLASDALEGRDTPSKGLDAAADYIASRFRAAGVEAIGDTGYFQTAAFETVMLPADGLSLSVETGEQSVLVPKDNLVYLATGRLSLARAGLFLVDLDNLPAAATDQTRGKVLVVDLSNVQAWTPEQRTSRAPVMKDPPAALAYLGGAALLFNRSKKDSFGGVQLREASHDPVRSVPPVISVNDETFRSLVLGWKAGPVPATVDLSVPAPLVVPVVLKNVAGMIRGSDPTLRDTYLLVTAHYDHLGVRPGGDGDRTFNGANDNASGVAAMLDIAHAIAGAGLKPKRTILFVAFFGEEKSGMGSQWYVKHPIVPLAKTVADINLEQLGRTDDADGTHMANANITGFDYSDVGEIFAQVGPSVGVSFTSRDSSKYFGKGDNVFLARAGIPAHTVATTYEFPGRHTPGDKADKIDYANMELVTRAVCLGMWTLSTSAQAPRWRTANPEAQPYRDAWEKLVSAK